MEAVPDRVGGRARADGRIDAVERQARNLPRAMTIVTEDRRAEAGKARLRMRGEIDGEPRLGHRKVILDKALCRSGVGSMTRRAPVGQYGLDLRSLDNHLLRSNLFCTPTASR